MTLPRWQVGALLAAATLLLRIAEFDNPLSGFDEQFYLYVGEKMSQGLLPYADIFDRKPIGLFLIYEAASAFGGDRADVIAYHVLAAMFVIGTTLALYAIARRFAPERTALLAAIAYPVWLNLPGGAGGQAPVFYNLFMALAALVLVRLALRKDLSARGLLPGGAVVMLLVGCAMQIKYTAVFEGVYFGLFLMWLAARSVGPARALAMGVAWVAAALLPTALAATYYWQQGHLNAFIFANFTSIAGRGDTALLVLLKRLLVIAVIIAPLVLLAGPGLLRAARKISPMRPDGRTFLLGWLASAIGAVLLFGTYYPHYALAILPAACAAIGLSGQMGRKMWFAAIAVLLLAAIGGQIARHQYRAEKGGWATLEQLTAATGALENCPFFYDPPPALYDIGDYCAPTRYVFPGHLNQALERESIGVSPVAETARILARNPQAIVLRQTLDPAGNFATRALVDRAIAERYRLVKTISQGRSDYQVYRLRPEFRPLPNRVVP